MAEKKPEEARPKAETKKAEQKTAETVQLSAEELRKISGACGTSRFRPEQEGMMTPTPAACHRPYGLMLPVTDGFP